MLVRQYLVFEIAFRYTFACLKGFRMYTHKHTHTHIGLHML